MIHMQRKRSNKPEECLSPFKNVKQVKVEQSTLTIDVEPIMATVAPKKSLFSTIISVLSKIFK